MSGDGKSKAAFKYFTTRHPKCPIFARKELGVALIRIPDDITDYESGRKMQAFRTNRNRATKAGYVFQLVKPLYYIDDIMDVNSSMQVRQERSMSESYMDRRQVEMSWQDVETIPAVLDAAGVLVAYADISFCGEVAVISRILGYGEYLDNGIMYLLVDGIMRLVIERKSKYGQPEWLMYDTLLGAKEGLRYFKERLGFQPYRVKWLWKETPD